MRGGLETIGLGEVMCFLRHGVVLHMLKVVQLGIDHHLHFIYFIKHKEIMTKMKGLTIISEESPSKQI